MSDMAQTNKYAGIPTNKISKCTLRTQLTEHFRSLINESIQIRNWRRGKKYCSLLQLIQPLNKYDTLNWCMCLFYLADYFAVIRITKYLLLEETDCCNVLLKLLALKSESEFFVGKYSSSLDTSNDIVKYVNNMIKLESDIKKIFFLKQIKIRALLVQARIYEINNFSKKFVEINKNILLNEDPLNVVSLEVIFCSQRLLISEKIEIFKSWKLKVPSYYEWIVTLIQFRISCDRFQEFETNSEEMSGIQNISFRNSISGLKEMLGKIPSYTKKMRFTRCQIYSIPLCKKFDLSVFNKSHTFDPSGYLDSEREIVIRTISGQYETGLVLTASSILDEKIPLSPLSLFLMGCYYYKQSIYSKSAHLFRRVIEIEPGFYEAHMLLAHSLSLNSNHSQALLVYSHIQDQWKGSYYGTLYKGVEYLKNDIYDIAEINFKNSLLQSPNNPIILNEYGVLQFNKKQYIESVETLRKALNALLHNNINNKEMFSTIRINLSCSLIYSILYNNKNFSRSYLEEIIIHLQNCLKDPNINFDYYSINLILAITYQIMGEKKIAGDKYLECLSLGNSNQNNLEILHSMCI